MNLSGQERYFKVEEKEGKLYLRPRGLDGTAFFTRNWGELEEITLDGGEPLKRVDGWMGRFCVYEANETGQTPTSAN